MIAYIKSNVSRVQYQIRAWEDRWQSHQLKRFKQQTISENLFVFIVGVGILLGFVITTAITVVLLRANFGSSPIIVALGIFSVASGLAISFLFHLWWISLQGFFGVSVGAGLVLGILGKTFDLIDNGVQVAAAVIVVVTGIWIISSISPAILKSMKIYLLYAFLLFVGYMTSGNIALAVDANASTIGLGDWIAVVSVSFAVVNYLQVVVTEGPLTLDNAVDAATHLYIRIANAIFRKRLVFVLVTDNGKKRVKVTKYEDYSI